MRRIKRNKDFYGNVADIRTQKLFEILIDLSEIAEKHERLLVVQGGFAVDLEVGKITRNHEDLDIIVLEKEVEWFRELFKVDGYKFKYHDGQNRNVSFGAYKWNFIVDDSLYIDVDGVEIAGEKVTDLDSIEEPEAIKE